MMFKRFSAIILTVLYLVTVTGFALNLHYCGKLLTAVNINAPVKGCNNPMAAKMKCCKDKRLVVKIKDAHQTVTTCVLARLSGFEIAKLPFADISFYNPSVLILNAFDRGPPDPPLSSTPVFIKNCTFRI
jgi:hypothetical protein